MEWTAQKCTVRNTLKKYRWALLILAIGLMLMLFPEVENAKDPEPTLVSDITDVKPCLQEQLNEILSQLEGAGKVCVLLTELEGEQTIYQTDQNHRKGTETEEIQKDTVITTQADRSEHGLITRVDPPRYLGAIVLCQGADKASVRLAIVDAVSTATGLGADKISVWKMK